MSILLFFIGLWVGGLIGVFTMCVFQLTGKIEESEGAQQCLMNKAEGDLE